MVGGGRGPLVMYSGRLSGRSYVQVIEEALSLFIENTFDSSNNDWVFMHDNAPPHPQSDKIYKITRFYALFYKFCLTGSL